MKMVKHKMKETRPLPRKADFHGREPICEENLGDHFPTSFWRILHDMWEKRQLVWRLREFIYENDLNPRRAPTKDFLKYLRERAEKRAKTLYNNLNKAERDRRGKIYVEYLMKKLADCAHDGYITLEEDRKYLSIPRKGRELLEGMYWMELALQRYEKLSGMLLIIFGSAIGGLVAQGIIWLLKRAAH